MMHANASTPEQEITADDHIQRVTHAYRVLWPYLGEMRGDPVMLVALASLTDELLTMAQSHPRLVREVAADEIEREISQSDPTQLNTRTLVRELLLTPEGQA